MNEGLTQHDGIHCTTRTERNQNLRRENKEEQLVMCTVMQRRPNLTLIVHHLLKRRNLCYCKVGEQHDLYRKNIRTPILCY